MSPPPFTGARWIEEDRGYTTPCWIWQLFKTDRGYGRTRHKGRGRFAHGVMYEMKYGPVPEGLQLDHLCRVRACVNPDHLEPVTCAENIRRGSNAKLTMEKAEAIRRDDRRYAEIAAEYGVSVQTVCDVRKGRKWRSQALAASPKNAGDHVEAVDSTSVLATFDTLDTTAQIDLGVS